MKNLTKIVCMLALIGSMTTSADAQVFKSAIGARLGYPLAISYKTFVSEYNAVEFYGGFRGFGSYGFLSLNGAYQVHRDIDGIDNLQWYFGGGAYVNFWNYNFNNTYARTSFGVQGYLGLQYTFPDVPLSLTFDWVPGFSLSSNLFDNNRFAGVYGGLGVRYVLK